MGNDMPDKEVLLAEYSAAQSHVQSLHHEGWQATSIIVAGNLAALGLVLREDISPWPLLIVCFGMVVVLILWAFLVRRLIYFQRVTYLRMVEIEVELGMRRQIYVEALEYQLDDWRRKGQSIWGALPAEEQSRIEQHVRPAISRRFVHSSENLTYTLGVVIALVWLALFVVKTCLS